MSVINNILLDWKIVVLGCVFVATIFITNLKIPILPVSGLTFIICSVTVWFLSMCVMFVGLHKLLQHNEPLDFDVLNKKLLKAKTTAKQKHELKPNPDAVKRLTLDIDKYFISKWYCNVSKDNDFTVESKIFLEEVITRFVEVQLQVNNRMLLHECLNIYLKHLKEFRRSLKRKEKYNVAIDELYRYSHICNTSTTSKPKDYFLHQMTVNLLKQFINSELWNSLPCHALVSILARKLTGYILKSLSNPEILNYAILNLVASKDVKDNLKLDNYSRISITQYYDTVDSKENTKVVSPIIHDENKNNEEKCDKSENHKKYKDKKDMTVDSKEQDVQQQKSVIGQDVVLRRKKKDIQIKDIVIPESIPETRKKSDVVKIYEPKSTSTSKTWRDSRDLACVSLGQDPLDVLQQTPDTVKGVRTGPLSENTATKTDDLKEESPPNTANILFSEVMNITSMEGLKSSIKPISDATERTLHNIKDLQETTVHNALHKIGDFQDEAAGVVEGILDFGRAGFRKGLRLTGLQDNIENAKATISQPSTIHATKFKKKAALVRSDSPEKISPAESMETVWVNPLKIDSPNFDGQILLEKTRTVDNEVKTSPKVEYHPIPSISMEQPLIGNDSPDPEYEDTADLASSIAKLRSLLQQRSSESSLSTPALSPMPEEYAQRMADSENISDLEEVDGVMPSFYKFCTKTATGVIHNTLNTIKTALPGNSLEQCSNIEKWKFKSEFTESDLLIRMKKLLTERKEYCIIDSEIDAAYEAIDSLDSFQQSPSQILSLQFEDELDDFEAKLPITKALLDVMCELLTDTNSPFLQEPLIKSILLILGNSIENLVVFKTEKCIEYLAENLVKIPETSNTNTLNLELDAYIDAILNSCPEAVKIIMGRETLQKALHLFVSSVQVQKINQDVFLQIFELFSMKLIEESTLLSPPASA